MAFAVTETPTGTEKVQIRKDEFPIDDPEAQVILTPHLAGG